MLQQNSLSKAHQRNAKPPPTMGIQERMHKRYHKKATSTSRDDALKESNDPQLISRKPFVVTYNPMLPNLHKIFKDLQPCLSSSERCAEAFPNTPLVSYRHARNLSDMLCSKRLPPSTNRRPTSTTPENDTSPSNNT